MTIAEPSSAKPSNTRETSTEHSQAPDKRRWHRRPGQKIDDLLLKRQFAHAPLARLIHHSDLVESQTRAVRALLPQDLARAVEVVNFRPPSLVLRVESASLATRLRYLLPELSTKLRNLADFHDLQTIKLRVVQTLSPAEPQKTQRTLSPQAINTLTELAESLQDQPDYRQLRETILRLSEHTPPKLAAGRDRPKETPDNC